MQTVTIKVVLQTLSNHWKKALIGIIPSYIILKLLKRIYDDRKLPPLVRGYPFFGQANGRLYDPLFGYKLAQYGTLCYWYLFQSRIITINNSNLLRKIWQTYNKDILYRRSEKEFLAEFSGTGLITTYKNEKALPILLINSNKWKIRRKHAQTSLFRLLTNKKVNNIMKYTLKNVDNYLNNTINNNIKWYPREICMYSTFSAIFASCFGKTVSKDDQVYKDLSKCIDLTFRTIPISVLASRFPILLWFKSVRERVIDHVRLRESIVEKLLFERMAIYNNNKKLETYVDYSIKLYNEGKLKIIEILADIFVLFSAGQDTTSSTAEFGIILLAKDIELQNNIRLKLIEYHKNRNKNEFDLECVRYIPEFRALAYEIIRIASVVTLGVVHQLRQDKYFTMDDGTVYKIPKNTSIAYNAQYISKNNKDESWIKPGFDICLDNWLYKDNNNKTQFKLNNSFVSFGIGRRNCVGKMLAIKEIQTITGHLLMNYKWELYNKNQKIKHNGGVTIVIDPPMPVKIQRLHK